MEKIGFAHPTVLTVEHGDTEFSEPEERIHGIKYDLPLSPKGRKQMERAAKILSRYDICSVTHSPQKRSTESARIIARSLGVKPEMDERLKPMDSGRLSGLTHGAVKDWLVYYILHPRREIPDGQSYASWYGPWSEALAEELEEAKKYDGQARLLVLHSSEIMSVPAAIRGELPNEASEWSPTGGEVSVIERVGGKWRFFEDLEQWHEDSAIETRPGGSEEKRT